MALERKTPSEIDGIPGLVATMTPGGAIEAVNPQISEYCGQSLEQLRSWGTNGTIHPEDAPTVTAQFIRSINAGEPYDFECRIRRHDGAYRWFQVRGLPFWESGRIVRWYVLLTDIDDRKHAEQALRAREHDLRLIVESIPALAMVTDPVGRHEFTNQRVLDYYGKTFEEIRDWPIRPDLVHPDDLAHANEVVSRTVAASIPYQDEYRLRRHDGVYRWFEGRGLPYRNELGEIQNWYVLLIDIEDRKRAETELRRAYDSFADAQRLSKTGSFITDLVADDHHWSDEAYRIFEFDPGTKVTVRRIRDIVHPDDLAMFDSVIERGAAGIDVDFVFRIVTAKGIKHVRGVAHVVEEVAGQPMFVGALQDVTDNKVAEEALRRSEAFLAHGQAVSETGSFLWNLETGDIRWSNQMYRIFEFEPGSPVTLDRIASRVHPLDLPLMDDMVARAQASLDSEFEHRLLLPNGSTKYLHFVAQAVRDREGRQEYMGSVQDITERRLAEQALDKVRSELAHAARAMSLGVLTASLAHEVNQPLAGIITNASTCLRMLTADPPNVSGALDTARRTIRDGNRASEVVTRLRGLFGKKEFATEVVDLNEATREVIALSLHELQRHRITVHTQLADGPLLLVGDRVQLQQVVLNLLLNASDAMKGVEGRPRQLFITSMTDDAGSACLSVRDSGTGVAAESLGKVFDAFFTTKHDGMGIGLSVSRSIIERHRGQVWAAQNEGPGATFSFSIPRQPPEHPAR
jgi:PAS domain S-box-containing protein